MTFAEALDIGKKQTKETYIVYTVINGLRFSYVNQYKGAYETAKTLFIRTKRDLRIAESWKLTTADEQKIKKSLEGKMLIFYQKEQWSKENGWVVYNRIEQPDDEICHYILTAEWGYA